MVNPHLFGIFAKPGTRFRLFLAVVPFVLLAVFYVMASNVRHRANPDDKLLPTASQMVDAAQRMAFEPDPRSGKYLMLEDTKASVRRIAIGLGLAALAGLLLGLNMGLFPGLDALSAPFLTFVAMIPPLAILPILFVTLGVDELAKVALIFIGVFPVIARDIAGTVARLPDEQITKALTLGASQLALVYRVVLPQIWPRLIVALRLSLGSAWLFLIASEAIAATEGLGYRIFLMRRYLAMDVIIPYVLWITALGFGLDSLLRLTLAKAFPWYDASED